MLLYWGERWLGWPLISTVSSTLSCRLFCSPHLHPHAYTVSFVTAGDSDRWATAPERTFITMEHCFWEERSRQICGHLRVERAEPCDVCSIYSALYKVYAYCNTHPPRRWSFWRLQRPRYYEAISAPCDTTASQLLVRQNSNRHGLGRWLPVIDSAPDGRRHHNIHLGGVT